MDKLSKAAKRNIILALVFGLLILASWFIYNSLVFRVTNTNPNTNNISSIAPFFKINFTKNITDKNLSVTSSDSSTVRSIEAKDKTVTVTFSSLELDKIYTISLNNVESSSGDTIKDKYFSFTTKDIAYDKLPKDQQQGIIDNQSFFSGANSDPILSYMPASSLHYTMTPSFTADSDGKNVLTINVKLLLSNADIGPGEKKVVASYKKEALGYIKSLGFDINKYTFVYDVVKPS